MMRRPKLLEVIAIVVPLVLIGIGVAAWNDAGVQPVEDRTVKIPLPALSPERAK